MKKFGKYIFILLLFAAMLSCQQKDSRINIAGSTTVLPIVQAAAEVYTDLHLDIGISVRGGGSGVGIKSALEESIDIGSSSRKLNRREQELVEEKLKNIVETAIARDAISIVIHPSNPVMELSLWQLRGIFLGEINNWKEVGGDDLEIAVVSRDVSSGSFEVFNNTVLDSSKVKRNSMMLASNNAVATTVSYTPGAIGYVGLGFLRENLKIVAIEGVIPSAASVRNGSYELTRKLYMYTNDTPRKLAEEFIDFILSEAGQQIVEAQGFVRIK